MCASQWQPGPASLSSLDQRQLAARSNQGAMGAATTAPETAPVSGTEVVTIPLQSHRAMSILPQSPLHPPWHLRIIFSHDARAANYRLHVIDASKLHVKLADVGKHRCVAVLFIFPGCFFPGGGLALGLNPALPWASSRDGMKAARLSTCEGAAATVYLVHRRCSSLRVGREGGDVARGCSSCWCSPPSSLRVMSQRSMGVRK